MADSTPLTETLVVAPIDSTGHAGFVMVLEELLGDRTPQWLEERKSAWGIPSNGPEERTQWLREPYIAVVELEEGYRFTFVGYLDAMVDVFNRGKVIHDRATSPGH
jgi:hypothetical protein